VTQLGWLDDTIDPSSLKPSTKASYRYLAETHIIPVIGDTRLSKLRAADIQRLLKVKREERLSDRTRQLIHAVLRRALGDAERWGLIGRNWAATVQAPRPRRDPEKVHALDLNVAHAVLEAARDTRLFAAYVVLLLMGLRKGELLALR
jgi:integrase